MNDELKTRLFANVLLSPNEQPAVFRPAGRSAISLSGIVATTLAVLSASGLVLLLFTKLKPLL